MSKTGVYIDFINIYQLMHIVSTTCISRSQGLRARFSAGRNPTSRAHLLCNFNYLRINPDKRPQSPCNTVEVVVQARVAEKQRMAIPMPKSHPHEIHLCG